MNENSSNEQEIWPFRKEGGKFVLRETTPRALQRWEVDVASIHSPEIMLGYVRGLLSKDWTTKSQISAFIDVVCEDKKWDTIPF